MNLPVGNPVEQGTELKNFHLVEKTQKLLQNSFTGYVVGTIDGFDGVEEAIIFMKKGEVIGALHEYSKHVIETYGDAAFKACLNCFGADKGIVDVYELTAQQIDLVIAFNEKFQVSSGIGREGLKAFKVSKYTSELAQEDLKGVSKDSESRYSLLKKLGLGKFG
ncbi:MAG: DUF2226 domain-containing protein [Candidatus Diapherotrites archaeon]|nr:DUF2226 domain-containing protein [Candidatus Diapherotrites archaeon]